MWNFETGLGDLLLFVEQQIEVERPRAVRHRSAAVATERPLEGQQGVEQLARRERRLQLDDSVQEPWLLEDADGLGVAQRRNPANLCPGQAAEAPDRRPEGSLAIPQVRPEADECACHGPSVLPPQVL